MTVKSRLCFIVLLLVTTLFLVHCKKGRVRYLPILGVKMLDSVSRDTIYHKTEGFKIMDQMGQMVTQDTFSHKIYVANFFFVTCPGICKQMNNELEKVEKAFAGNSKVKFLSFTVNPQDDSIPVLAGYAKAHDAVPYQWYFVRGDHDKVLELARHSYLAETDGYLVHSQNLTLVDGDGHIRGVYSGTVESDVTRLIADIKLLLKEESE
jgi:protein SCO1/2